MGIFTNYRHLTGPQERRRLVLEYRSLDKPTKQLYQDYWGLLQQDPQLLVLILMAGGISENYANYCVTQDWLLDGQGHGIPYWVRRLFILGLHAKLVQDDWLADKIEDLIGEVPVQDSLF
jgi:hypothetical protein